MGVHHLPPQDTPDLSCGVECGVSFAWGEDQMVAYVDLDLCIKRKWRGQAKLSKQAVVTSPPLVIDHMAQYSPVYLFY